MLLVFLPDFKEQTLRKGSANVEKKWVFAKQDLRIFELLSKPLVLSGFTGVSKGCRAKI